MVGASRLKFFLPDSQDFVDPSFDFDLETRSPDRVRQRDDLYTHEVFGRSPVDGVLLSRGIVETTGCKAAHFGQAQRLRLYREGVRSYYRLPGHIQTMGDCGAFTYKDMDEPPFSAENTADFYEAIGFDFGIAVDHIVMEYTPARQGELFSPNGTKDSRRRHALTLDLAADFWRASRGRRFKPMGVAHGWDPDSYASSFQTLQAIGYDYIAIGGVVSLKSDALVDLLRRVNDVRKPKSKIHLLGIARVDQLVSFAKYGVSTFDSTSPLRQAWLDARKNYHVDGDSFVALRIPQVGGNAVLKRRIASGEVDQNIAFSAEKEALRQVARYASRKGSARAALRALVNYEAVHSPTKSRVEEYRRTLEAAPWRRCPCEVCKSIGHHVIVFRGAERNRRRGFHNVWSFRRAMERKSA